ncbi:DUF3114 domain-containing protein [Bombilactobacillus thymidiniphilus]|uniref:DUF3114 domain-containing protein n=1 Tax=Bombilactobacillus thymidiniphilus TaxID=2923363 RepID=UPI0037BFBEB9
MDPEGAKPNGVINGASFNYANENDDMHKHLDINVVKNWTLNGERIYRMDTNLQLEMIK